MEEFDNLSREELEDRRDFINDRIKEYDRSGSINEANYLLLLRQRIYLSEKLGKVDEVISTEVNRASKPAREEYNVNDNVKVVVEYKDMFMIEADTMVNAIHVENGFESKERAGSGDFIKRLGGDSFQQPSELKSKKPGDFIILDHPNISAAPKSYHILFYKDIPEDARLDSLDLETLSNGIKNVLSDVEKTKLKKISFFALGFHYVRQFQAELRNEVSESLAETIAKTIFTYFEDNKSSSIKTIYFGMISYRTMRTFDRAFFKWSIIYQSKMIEGVANRLHKRAITKSENYKIQLNSLASIVDEADVSILITGETGAGKSFLDIAHSSIIFFSSSAWLKLSATVFSNFLISDSIKSICAR